MGVIRHNIFNNLHSLLHNIHVANQYHCVLMMLFMLLAARTYLHDFLYGEIIMNHWLSMGKYLEHTQHTTERPPISI